MWWKCVVGQCSKFRRKPKRHKLQITSFSVLNFTWGVGRRARESNNKTNYYGSFFWKADLPRCLRNNAKCATMQSEGVITRVWSLKTFKVEDVVRTFMPLKSFEAINLLKLEQIFVPCFNNNVKRTKILL